MRTKVPLINLRTLETFRNEIYKDIINAEAFLYGSAVEKPDVDRGIRHLEQARKHMERFLDLCSREAMQELANGTSLYISLKDEVWDALKELPEPNFDITVKRYRFAVRAESERILVYQQYTNRFVCLGHLERGKDFVVRSELCDDPELEEIRNAFESFEQSFLNGTL